MINEVRKELTEAVWENKLRGSTIQVLSAIECYGIPEDVAIQIKILGRLREQRDGDYPVTMDALKQYCPKLFQLTT